MKKIFIIGALAFSIGALTSCEKKTEMVAKTENVDPTQAFLKVNYVSNYASNPSVQLKLNGTRVSNLITARTPFPGGGYNTGGGSASDYLQLSPGATNLSIAIPNAGMVTDSIILYSTNFTLEAGKHYSAHVTDTSVSTKFILLEDDLTRPDTGKAKYRFVNLMPNVAAIDLYYGTTVVASNIPYLGNSGYFTMAIPASSSAWSIREAGTSPTSTALATYTSGNTTQEQRVYTAFALGYKGQSTTARKPYISFYLNN